VTDGKTGVQIQAAVARVAPERLVTFFQRLGPVAAIAFGLGLTTVWISFLGYGLVTLIGLMI
jgi:hypothetical protein